MSQQNQLFVGNMSFNTEESDLEQHFGQFGKITEIKIPKDRESGRKRGFAFITFDSQSSAEAALSMNGKELDGREIRVNIAEGKKDSRGGGNGGRGRSY